VVVVLTYYYLAQPGGARVRPDTSVPSRLNQAEPVLIENASQLQLICSDSGSALFAPHEDEYKYLLTNGHLVCHY